MAAGRRGEGGDGGAETAAAARRRLSESSDDHQEPAHLAAPQAAQGGGFAAAATNRCRPALEGCGLWASTMLTSSSSLSLKPQLAESRAGRAGGAVIPSPGPGIQGGWGEALEGGNQAPALGSEDRQLKNSYRPSEFTVRASAGSAGSLLVPDGGVTAPARHRPGTRGEGGGVERGGGKRGDSEGGGGGRRG